MSGFLGFMDHRATVQQRSTTKDALGHPANTFTDKKTNMRCRLETRRRSDTPSDVALNESGTVYNLFMGPDEVVTVDDILSVVKDGAGVVLATNLEVKHVDRLNGYQGRAHHQELILQTRVSGD